MSKNQFISFYDQSNIDFCPWPKNKDGEYGQKFLAPMIAKGVHHFVSNIEGRMGVLLVGDLVLPITINDKKSSNTFVSSPYSQYVSCTSIITDRLQNRFLKFSLSWILKAYGKLMDIGQIDKVIMVNNWLFTTNPNPRINSETIHLVSEFLKNLFPQHALLFRSVIQKTNSECYESLVNNGYHLIANKYVYITDAKNEDVFKTRILKSDLKFVRESDFDFQPLDALSEVEINSVQKLYNDLYIQKHCQYSPNYTSEFIKLLIDSRFLNFLAVKKGAQLQGVAGYYYRDGQMISPFLGYNPQTSDNKAVYRYLSTQLLLEAQKKGAVFNQSAGGSFYKKVRRAEGNMEYTAVYQKHLPLPRRIPWKILSLLSNSLGQMYMKRY